MKKSLLSQIKVLSLFLALISCNSSSFSQTVNHWETAIFNSDTWRYLAATAEPSTSWKTTTFSDVAWKQAAGGFGFGGWEKTTVPNCNSLYLRYKFSISDTSKISKGLLQMNYNDAFVAYLNGVEIGRAGITGNPPSYNQTGTPHAANMDIWNGTLYSGKPENFLIEKTKLKTCIKPGDNVLAIQVHNSQQTSYDLTVDAFLSFGISTTTKYFRPTPYWFEEPIAFTSSNLPIITIDTDGKAAIVDEPKTGADMKIFANTNSSRNNLTDNAAFSGRIGIEIRGSSSAGYPQTPYGLETRDALGVNLDTMLLGMPSDNDWVFLSNYNDKSLARNSLSFDIFRQMGHYAPRIKHCEVVINNDYRGIYLFGEKIKQHKGRVDIANLTPQDLTGDSLTGGYIFKTDYDDGYGTYWNSNFSPLNKPKGEVRFVYHDPKAKDLVDQQKNYISSYINSLETVLYGNNFKDPVTGYRAYLDVNSFIDYWILEEVARNVDGYKKSRFFYKNKNSKDKLVYSGPCWDFDWAWKNLDDCDLLKNTTGAGWAYRINECAGGVTPTPPSWEVRLLQDPTFANAVNARYFSLRKTVLSTTYINHYLDSIAGLVNEAQGRHFLKYKTLGTNNGAPEIDAIPTTYAGEVQKLKNWIATRLAWLDANMVGTKTDNPLITSDIRIRIFPNPVQETLYVESDNEIRSISLYNPQGNLIMNIPPKNDETGIKVSHLPAGMYIVKVALTNGATTSQKLIKD